MQSDDLEQRYLEGSQIEVSEQELVEATHIRHKPYYGNPYKTARKTVK